MFSAAVTEKLLEATITYGVPAIINLIQHWEDDEPTVEELKRRLDELPRAEDAFK